MIFAKYFARRKEKEKTLLNVRPSETSPYLWKQKSFLERLYLVPQYLLAYILIFDLYVLQYTAGKAYGVPFYIVALVGLFGDGTTYTQLFCLLFTFWSFGAALALRLFLNHPKRLQWFYDIVGEKRVKPLLFQNPTAKSLFFRTVPVILGLITLDGINDMGCEHKHHTSKQASLDDAHKAFKLLHDQAQERFTNHLQQTENQEQREEVTTALLEEQKEISKQLYATCDKINARERTRQSFLKALMRSERSRQVIGAIEKIGTSVFGCWGEKKKVAPTS